MLDAYIRVSRVLGRQGDAYISPSVQREAIERWAEYKAVQIGAWHVDEDQTGGDTNRPGLDAAVARVLAGETAGIVAWKIDRFSRNTEDGLRVLRELQAHDARLAFVTEDIDTSGVMGRFVYTVMLAMATHFLDSIKASWVEAKTRAHGRGAKIGPTPLGYRRNEDGTLVVHKPEAAVVRAAFKAAARDGLAGAVRVLNDAELRHETGARAGNPRTATTNTVRRLLANRTYMGELRWGTLPPFTDSAVAIVTRTQWEAAQPAPAAGRTKRSSFPLSGIARCGTCGEEMVGGRAGKSQRTYRCRASMSTWRGERCPAGVNVLADNLESYVREAMREALADIAFEQTPESPDLAAAEDALRGAEAELDDFLADTAGAATLRRLGRYDAALLARAEAIDRAREAYRSLVAASRRALSAAPADLLDHDDPAALRELAAATLAGVIVGRGRGSLAGRTALIRHGAPMPAVNAR